jgi:hypothetical protein
LPSNMSWTMLHKFCWNSLVSNVYIRCDVVESRIQVTYKINNDEDFEPQPPVYAILTDLQHFYFFSYDGSTFRMDTEIRVSSATGTLFRWNGRRLASRLVCKIFHAKFVDSRAAFFFHPTSGLYLYPMINAVIERSKKRGIIGNVSTYIITCYSRRFRW